MKGFGTTPASDVATLADGSECFFLCWCVTRKAQARHPLSPSSLFRTTTGLTLSRRPYQDQFG
jgi:hypothetical protein